MRGVIAHGELETMLLNADGRVAISFLLRRFFFEHEGVALHAESAVREPRVLGHLDHQLVLALGGGLLFFHKALKQRVVVFLFFDLFEDVEFAAEPVSRSVLRDFGFAFGGLWPGGLQSIAYIGCDLFRSCHIDGRFRPECARGRCGAEANAAGKGLML